ncbi:MAG: hypothetical protein HDT43_13355 [Ruminococcaceae bacterium]|nr:hypothetical protein [Oscillospiraceae bacterium]
MKWGYFIVPACFIVTGVIMLLIPNSTVFAFKTLTASKNEETQKFCNVLSARIMIVLGIISAVALILTWNVKTGLFGYSMDDTVMAITMAALVLSLPIVNICCRKKFSELFTKNDKK